MSQNVEFHDDDFSDDNALPLLETTIAARYAQPPSEDLILPTSEVDMHRPNVTRPCNVPKDKCVGDSSPGDFAKFLVKIDGQVRSVELGNLKKRKKDE